MFYRIIILILDANDKKSNQMRYGDTATDMI